MRVKLFIEGEFEEVSKLFVNTTLTPVITGSDLESVIKSTDQMELGFKSDDDGVEARKKIIWAILEKQIWKKAGRAKLEPIVDSLAIHGRFILSKYLDTVDAGRKLRTIWRNFLRSNCYYRDKKLLTIMTSVDDLEEFEVVQINSLFEKFKGG